MKASELIKELKKLIQVNGDIEVIRRNDDANYGNQTTSIYEISIGRAIEDSKLIGEEVYIIIN